MTQQKPTVVLVHGAFAESASWNGVIERLQAADRATSIAVANPLRSVAGDAAYVRDVIAGIDGPVILVGHSYGGMVITEAAAGNDAVVGLVYVCAFAPEHGESALRPVRRSSPAAPSARPSPPTRSPPAATSSPSARTPSTSSSPPTSPPPRPP